MSNIKCPTCGQPVDVVEHNAQTRLSIIRETLGCVPGQTEVAAASARMAEIERLRAELAQEHRRLVATEEDLAHERTELGEAILEVDRLRAELRKGGVV